MTAREKLLQIEDVYDRESTSEIFLEAMRDCLAHHMANNDFFRECMERAGVKPEDIKTEEDLVKIPPIHANFFKKYEVLSVPYEEIVEQDYTLSVSSYVEQEDTREEIDIAKLNKEIEEIVAREQVLRTEIAKIIAELEG